jgi:hypothetical protein
MSLQTENRLRSALAAKADGITEGMLRQPRLPERAAEFADYDGEVFRLDPAAQPVGPTDIRHRLRPQLVAAVALAAAAAVVLAALAIAGWPAGRRPANPGEPSTSAPAATSSPAPTSSPSGYLGQGQTGSRDQVPWSAVGAGWRLFQPLGPKGATTPALYLYDPADGRYLITDRLPAGGRLLDWSPDGARALVQTPAAVLQIQLRTGAVVSSARMPNSVEWTYADPPGSAIIVFTQLGKQTELRRYGMDGRLQQRYPSTGPDGVNAVGGVLATDDGAELIVASPAGNTMLLTQTDTLVRRYPLPDGATQCTPMNLWADGFLESCDSQTGPPSTLYVQPLAGGPARVLIDQPGLSGGGYSGAWQLSNGDLLLRNQAAAITTPCVDENYSLLHPDGTLSQLRLPASIAPITRLENVNHDMATFKPGYGPCSDLSVPSRPAKLVDFNVVTGQTVTLVDDNAEMVNYPTEG